MPSSNSVHYDVPKPFLLFSPTKEGCDFILRTLPFESGRINVVHDFRKARKTLESGRVQLLIVDQTVIDQSTRDLLMFANCHSINVQAFSLVQSGYPKIEADVWKIDRDHTFHHEKAEIDGLTIPLSGLLHEGSSLSWGSSVRESFGSMRDRLSGKPGESVLLIGAEGTGKLSLSQIAHFRGKRRFAPFVYATCKSADIQRHRIWTDIDMEDFRKSVMMMARTAAKGTLYFHEVDYLDIEAQNILAELISEFRKNRSVKHPEIVICATRKNLEELVADNVFSTNLMRELKRNVIRIPSLSEHDNELIDMAKELLNNYCHFKLLKPKVMSKNVEEMLSSHVWGRNIRELLTVMTEAVLTTKGSVIDTDAFTFRPHVRPDDTPKDKARKIKTVLADCKGNVRKAAIRLETSHNTLYRWMAELGIPTGYGRKAKAQPKD